MVHLLLSHLRTKGIRLTSFPDTSSSSSLASSLSLIRSAFFPSRSTESLFTRRQGLEPAHWIDDGRVSIGLLWNERRVGHGSERVVVLVRAAFASLFGRMLRMLIFIAFRLSVFDDLHLMRRWVVHVNSLVLQLTLSVFVG